MFILTSTAGPDDATSTVYLGVDEKTGQRREIHVGGDPVALTDAELAMVYSTGCRVEEVSDDGSDAAERAAKNLDEMQAAMPKEIKLTTDDQLTQSEPASRTAVKLPAPEASTAPTATAGPTPVNPNVPSKGV